MPQIKPPLKGMDDNEYAHPILFKDAITYPYTTLYIGWASLERVPLE